MEILHLDRDYFVMRDGSVWCDNYHTFESQEASIGFDNCIVEYPDVVWEVDNSGLGVNSQPEKESKMANDMLALISEKSDLETRRIYKTSMIGRLITYTSVVIFPNLFLVLKKNMAGCGLQSMVKYQTLNIIM